MYIDAQTIITAAAVLGAGSALLGALFAAYRWYQRQNKQDEDIKAMKEEMGLKEQGCNGPVTAAIDKIEKHMNQEAHK